MRDSCVKKLAAAIPTLFLGSWERKREGCTTSNPLQPSYRKTQTIKGKSLHLLKYWSKRNAKLPFRRSAFQKVSKIIEWTVCKEVQSQLWMCMDIFWNFLSSSWKDNSKNSKKNPTQMFEAHLFNRVRSFHSLSFTAINLRLIKNLDAWAVCKKIIQLSKI